MLVLLLLLLVVLLDELVLDYYEEEFEDPLDESNKELEEVREVQSYFEKHLMIG